MSGKAAEAETVYQVSLGDTAEPVLSATQMKKRARKLARKESQQEKRKERKAAKKERNAAAVEKKQQESAERFAALTEEEKKQNIETQRLKKRARDEEKQQQTKKLKAAADNAPKIIVDLDFWDKMRESERVSLVSQLGFCVGVNRKAAEPCSLHYTSFCTGVLQQTKKQFPQHTNWMVGLHEDAWAKAFEEKKDSIVYLTADSPDQIDALDKDCMYVVGGIVDRNRYPQLCLKKAQELGVHTAKLPIGDYLKLTGSKVLTVNQTVEILVKFWGCKDWKEAVTTAVPTRKGEGNHQ